MSPPLLPTELWGRRILPQVSKELTLWGRDPDASGGVVVTWVVAGPDGAAARLGVRRTTLINKMKRLGIERPVPADQDGRRHGPG